MAGCRGGRPAEVRAPETLSIVVTDNLSLGCTLYRSHHARPPGLLLLHRMHVDRGVWHPFALRMQQSGYIVLALDLRGHAPKGVPPTSAPENWADTAGDVHAGLDVLRKQGADPENLAVVGEGLGGSIALVAAVDTAEIQAVVLLSPGLEEHGIQAEEILRKLAQRPVLILASEGDAYSAASASALKNAAPGFSELHTYTGTAHGVNLLDTNVEAADVVAYWLGDTIGLLDSAQP
jgi:pimeloyl-ACP methyl ester carboxylesterase